MNTRLKHNQRKHLDVSLLPASHKLKVAGFSLAFVFSHAARPPLTSKCTDCVLVFSARGRASYKLKIKLRKRKETLEKHLLPEPPFFLPGDFPQPSMMLRPEWKNAKYMSGDWVDKWRTRQEWTLWQLLFSLATSQLSHPCVDLL